MNELQAPMSWAVLKEQADMLLKSQFLPSSIRTAEQVIAIVLTGRELNVGMMEALRGINVIQGKPSVSPQLMLALANRTGELQNIKIETSREGALVEITRKGRAPHTERFGPVEARDLGLMSKDNYTKQPATMFKWRALAAALRVTFPDAISGLYTPEELGAEVIVDQEGAMEIVNPETGEVVQDVPKTHKNAILDAEPGKYTFSPNPQESTAIKVTPAIPANPPTTPMSDGVASHWMSKMLDLVLPMCEKNIDKAEKMILEASAFPSKKTGKTVKAKDFGQLFKSEAWTKSTYEKLNAMHEAWLKNQDMGPLPDDPDHGRFPQPETLVD